jgi:hypothetical protein
MTQQTGQFPLQFVVKKRFAAFYTEEKFCKEADLKEFS